MENIKVLWASALPNGYGHYKIKVELRYKDSIRTFSCITNNMPGYDEAVCLEEIQERNEALYQLIAHKIEDEVMEWCFEIDY